MPRQAPKHLSSQSGGRDMARRALIAGLFTLVVGLMVGEPGEGPLGTASSLAQFELTPRSLPTVSPTATATPRVIVINRPASTPTPTPRPTSTPSPTTATSTPVSRVIATAQPTATPRPLLIPTLIPTSPAPTAAIPAPTLAPTATVIPTIAATSVERITFTAEDWRGGFYRGDSLAYGRPWVAVYGALSAYPRAALAFSLDADPVGTSSVTITGLDDEWDASNDIALQVNGEAIFTGPSPFANWDGIGSGANAAWTSVSFTIPPGLLRSGLNDIVVANLTPSGNFNAPPYVLLADAALELRNAPGEPAPPTASAQNQAAVFAASDWRGGYYRGDGQAYGRPWTALYGAWSDYPRATLVFRLATEPEAPVTLTLTGLDDELNALNTIAVEVNGREVFSGRSPFANWDGRGDGADAWTQATFTIPADVFQSGRNEITITNLTPAASFNGPPYVLLADAIIETPGSAVTARPGDR